MQQLPNGWLVDLLVDDDGHLNVFVKNKDGTTVNEVETGQGDGKNGEPLAFRATTERIENSPF